MSLVVRTPAEDIGHSYFNANKLTPEQVASLFVASTSFDKLVSNENVILTGPRGSGKTTLMKMVTRAALDEWGAPLAKRLLARSTLPLYISSDSVTRSQLEAPDAVVKDDRSRAALSSIRRAKLELQFLQTVLEAVEHEVEVGRAGLDTGLVPELINRLASIYSVEASFPSLSALDEAVSDELLTMSDAIQRAADGDRSFARRLASRRRVPALADTITETRKVLCDAIRGLPHHWSLLFDEIEYLHASARQEVVGLIRALDASFGVKIAMTPLSLTGDCLSELEQSYLHAGHDFVHLSLGYGDTTSILRFATDLVRTVLERDIDGIDFKSIEQFFGVSAFAHGSGVASVQSRRERLSSDEELIHALAASQPRFRRYAEKTGLLVPGVLGGLTERQRAAKWRKPRPVVVLWQERLRPSAADTANSRRGRKSRIVYTGAPTLLVLSDGNPRVLLGMLYDLLAGLRIASEGGFTASLSGMTGIFPAAWQDEVLDDARLKQLSLANAYMSSHGRVWNDLFAIELLHQIGLLFETNVHLSPTFNPDPATSFVVDTELSPDFQAAIVDAVYTGVLVSIDPVKGTNVRIGEDIVGRRFRLSHLQATEFWLPIRKGRQVNLSQVLRRLDGAPRTVKVVAPAAQQRGLFEVKD